MLKNYYITAIRNLAKQRGYFLLNVSGLAIGIASFIFISLFIHNELSYDKFHAQADHIYRVHVKGQMLGQTLDGCLTSSPMAKALVNDYPEIVNATRIKESGSWVVGYGDKKFHEDGILFADSSFFNVFGFQLTSGDPNTALNDPKSMVLTESYVKKYFGDEDPMGKTITIEHDTTLYTITGVMPDIPDNSHFKFDMMGSIKTRSYWNNNHWVSHNFYTYVLLNPNTNLAALKVKIQDLSSTYVTPQIENYLKTSINDWTEEGNVFQYDLMSITDIHLMSHLENEFENNGNLSYIYIYSLVAIILLTIAIINFVNLATAQSASRAKEVGIRKVTGSTKMGLIYQFIFESIIVSAIATALSFAIVTLLLPYFTSLVGTEMTLNIFTTPWVWFALLGLAIFIGILAGVYPAFVLASFRPVKVLNGTFSSGAKSSRIRNTLVVIQFTASIIIMISTAVIYYQTQYMLNKNLGFDKEQILAVRRPDVLLSKIETFKNEILKNPNVSMVANTVSVPGKSHNYNYNLFVPEDTPKDPVLLYQNFASFEYAHLMGFELAKGRMLSKEFLSDSSAVILNESAAKLLGFEQPIGKRFINRNIDNTVDYFTIVGIVKDYHISSLREAVKPTILRLMPGNREGYLLIKINNQSSISETISSIEDDWYRYSNNKPFQYFFFDEDYEKIYKSEKTTGKIFLIFTFLSVFIACLGLIGLITFSITIRRKEIGIRKVLGANSISIAGLLSKEIFKLVILATVISWPLAYYASNYWLENFADRVAFQPWIYLASTILVGVIGMGAISVQTIKATSANPVESLRTE